MRGLRDLVRSAQAGSTYAGGQAGRAEEVTAVKARLDLLTWIHGAAAAVTMISGVLIAWTVKQMRKKCR